MDGETLMNSKKLQIILRIVGAVCALLGTSDTHSLVFLASWIYFLDVMIDAISQLSNQR
jgi:hypothetical protein